MIQQLAKIGSSTDLLCVDLGLSDIGDKPGLLRRLVRSLVDWNSRQPDQNVNFFFEFHLRRAAAAFKI